MRLLLHSLPGLVFLLLLAAFVAWIELLPPGALPLPRPSEAAHVNRAAFDDITVVNPGLGREPHQRIEIAGDRIMRIADADGGARFAEGRMDDGANFAGLYALPGLVDMHAHLSSGVGLYQEELFGFLFLAHGVTSVREMGSLGTASLELRRRVWDGELVSPNIFACASIGGGDPSTWPTSSVARSRAEGRTAVDELARRDVDCVEIYSSLSAEALEGVRERTRELGLAVVGQVPEAVPFEEALVDDSQHLTGLLGAEVSSFPAPAVANLWIDPDPARIEKVVRVSREHGLAHTPTLVFFERLGRMVDYESQREDPVGHLLPRFYRDVVWHPTAGLPFLRRMDDGDLALVAAGLAGRMKMLRALHAAGVALHAGTGAQAPFVVPGASLHEELLLLAKVGISAEEVLALATRASGEFLGVPLLGTVQVGAPADLLFFREDPSRDLAALSTLEVVVARGRVYSREVIDRGLALYRDQFESTVFDGLSTALTRVDMRWLFDARVDAHPGDIAREAISTHRVPPG